MKKIKLFCGILIGLMLFSSFKSEDKVISNSIIGTWKGVKKVRVCETGSEDSYYYNSCEKKTRFIFSENGSLRLNLYSDTDEGCEYESFTGTWSVNGTEITTKIFGQTITEEILKLTKNVMRLGLDYTNKIDYDNNCFDDDGHIRLISYEYTEFKRVK